jgi:MoaA/NifB/PqqE/SkfB family radical SAM enzyme
MEKIRKAFQILWQAVTLPWRYKRSIWYLLKRGELKDLYTFLFVKYFVADEGGDMSLLNNIISNTGWSFLAHHPFKLEIEHTTVCNKRCIHCEHTHWKEKAETVNLEQIKSIVEQFPKLKWINLTGEGDNFLNPDYMNFIEYLREKKISVNFVDEFDFIESEKAKRLVELGVNCIWISMDGATKETYEKIKVGCNFEKAVHNIRVLQETKKKMGSPLPTLCFRFIVSNQNYLEMPRMVELIHSFGDLGEGSRLEFTGLLTFKEIEHLKLSSMPEEIIEETKRKAKELSVPISFSHLKKEELPSINKCSAWTEPYIMMGGYVLPCCAILMSNRRDFLRKNAFGNIFEKPFKEIWNSERYRKFRAQVLKKDGQVPLLCAGCRGYNTREREEKYGISQNI